MLPPKRSDENNAADWFYLASDGLKTADLVWNAEGLTPSGIELLQEAMERCLKGYLIAKGWSLVKTHCPSLLVWEAMPFDARFGRFTSLADELTRGFFAQHYPGGDWQVIGRRYPDLRRQTGEGVGLIRDCLPQYSHDLPAL